MGHHRMQSLDDPILSLLVCMLVYAFMQTRVQVCVFTQCVCPVSDFCVKLTFFIIVSQLPWQRSRAVVCTSLMLRLMPLLKS